MDIQRINDMDSIQETAESLSVENAELIAYACSVAESVQGTRPDTAAFEQRVLRIEAAVKNVIERYSYYVAVGRHGQCTELFALKTLGVRVEMTGGSYEGPEGIKKLYASYHECMVAAGSGGAVRQLFSTAPMVTVDDVTQTATAVWFSPGVAAFHRNSAATARYANWAWLRFSADFVVENSQWRILRLGASSMADPPGDLSWLDTQCDYC